MRKLSGIFLALVGAFCLYRFAVGGACLSATATGHAFDLGAPFATLGGDYPADVFFLLGAVWGLLLGLRLVGSGGGRPVPGQPEEGGAVARLALYNTLLLCSSLLAAGVGVRAGNITLVGIFGAMAVLQIVCGLVVMILAFLEHPKSPLLLGAGTALYVLGAVVGILALVGGGQ